MKEQRVHKLNKEKQSTGDGKYLYYFYDNRVLTSIPVDEVLFDELVALDNGTYNSNRREKARKQEGEHDIVDNSQEEDIIENLAEESLKDGLLDEDRDIYELCMEQNYTQAEIANLLNRTQGYVSKRLAKIKETLEREDCPQQQGELFFRKYHTDNDEDILLDTFHYAMPSEELTGRVRWFYSYKEYYKFCLLYLISRSFNKVDELEFGNRVNELPYANRYFLNTYMEDFPEGLQGLYIALCEKVQERKAQLKNPPSPKKFERIFEELEKIAKRVKMTGEQSWEERALPKYAKDREERYEAYRNKYSNIYVVDENDHVPFENG